MDLEELRTVQTRERATDGLQDLRDSFYTDVATYIQELREERDRVAREADDPFRNDEVAALSDEIEVAEQVAEAIYERRIGKLVKQASLAAAGMPDDQEGLTSEEKDLYEDLVERIRENKQGVLDVIAGDVPVADEGDPEPVEDAFGGAENGAPESSGGSPAPDEAGSPGEARSAEDARSTGDASSSGTKETASSGKTPDTPAADAMGSTEADGTGTDGRGAEETGTTEDTTMTAGESPAAGDDRGGTDVDRVTIRVTSDVGEIFGIDEREYSLEKDDVVRLPEENAAPLIERDAAERLE